MKIINKGKCSICGESTEGYDVDINIKEDGTGVEAHIFCAEKLKSNSKIEKINKLKEIK